MGKRSTPKLMSGGCPRLNDRIEADISKEGILESPVGDTRHGFGRVLFAFSAHICVFGIWFLGVRGHG